MTCKQFKDRPCQVTRVLTHTTPPSLLVPNCSADYLRSQGVEKVLDVACGTGVDSVMLCEEGFRVWSIDASDKVCT